VKYLGITIEHKLSFTEHTKTIAAKVARSIGILSKIKHFFPRKNRLTLYYSITHSYFLYDFIVWGHTYTTYFEPLKKFQNKAIRIVADAKWDEPSLPLYQNLEILSLSKLLKFETCKFIHKNLNNNLSSKLRHYYT